MEQTLSHTGVALGSLAGVSDPRPAERPHWTGASIYRKLTLLILLAATIGCYLGLLLGTRSLTWWMGVSGLMITVAGLLVVWLLGILMIRWAIVDPLRALLDSARSLHGGDPVDERLIRRADEIGELGKVVRDLWLEAQRSSAEAHQLRATFDERVQWEIGMATKHLQKMAMRDPLTGLGNRRFLDQHLPSLIESCRQSETDLVAILIDMDNFKEVNDSLGHATGDELLRFAAQAIHGSARKQDLTARLGGDEFVVLLPGATAQTAEQFIERCKSLLVRYVHKVLPADLQIVGFSAGVAALSEQDSDADGTLLERGDARLYEAKRRRKAGRSLPAAV